MVSRRAIPFVLLIAAILNAAHATAAQDDARDAASSARRPEKAKAVKPHCALEQGTCVPSPNVTQSVQLNDARGKAEDAKTQWIFQGPPQNSLPFQNDLSPVKKKPVGGLVGLEFPF